MKKITVDNLELILENNKLSVLRKKLTKLAPKKWIIETYKEDICQDINILCETCIFYKNKKCTYIEWKPGLIKGRKYE